MSTAVAVTHGRFGRASIYRLDRPLATHAHREGHLVFFLGGGTPLVTVGGDASVLREGVVSCVNPWQPHSFMPCHDGRASLVLLLYIKPSWFTEAGGPSCRETLLFGSTRFDLTPGIERRIARTAAMLMEDDRPTWFEQDLHDLTRDCFGQSWREAPSRDDLIQARPWRDFRVRNSMRLMEARLGSEIVLDEIARDAGMSRPHFYKLFKHSTGLTPNVFLNTLRMESAIERLTRTDEAVTSIGLDLGFASQASFTRFFTTNVGIPPSDYRRAALAA